jgi:hypothetical protein
MAGSVGVVLRWFGALLARPEGHQPGAMTMTNVAPAACDEGGARAGFFISDMPSHTDSHSIIKNRSG